MINDGTIKSDYNNKKPKGSLIGCDLKLSSKFSLKQRSHRPMSKKRENWCNIPEKIIFHVISFPPYVLYKVVPPYNLCIIVSHIIEHRPWGNYFTKKAHVSILVPESADISKNDLQKLSLTDTPFILV